MTRKAINTQAELKQFANLSTKEGVTIEIEREGTIIRIMPFQQGAARRQPEAECTLPRGPNALQAWRAIMQKRLGVEPREHAKPQAIKRPKT
ncbi:hypothetical protein [Rhizobiales bacterium]|uniref:hypothetical protein n=1 Tax=Agrobacterium radiobacter TaxID=362 RepID=UPI000DD8FFA3